MRVIAGSYGGRPLKSLPGETTRPTGDKLKETMFNLIGPYLNGETVLDLYAGSGALGIEAVSRGALNAVLVDKNRKALQVIKENIGITKEMEKFEVLSSTSKLALQQLSNRDETFSLIFLDPPYAKQTIEKDIKKMLEADLLADNARIICETDSDVELPNEIEDLIVTKNRQYGKVRLTIYEKGD